MHGGNAIADQINLLRRQIAAEEAARQEGSGPETLNDGLDASASPVDDVVRRPMYGDELPSSAILNSEVNPAAEVEAPEVVDVAPEHPSMAENRAAANPYMQSMQMRRMAAAAGMTREQAAGLVLSPDSIQGEGMRDTAGLLTATGRAAQYRGLRERGTDVRDAAAAASMERWKSQMMLASGNHRGNAVNAFNMLSDAGKQRVLESQMKGGGGGFGNQLSRDPRIAEWQIRGQMGADQNAANTATADADRAALETHQGRERELKRDDMLRLHGLATAQALEATRAHDRQTQAAIDAALTGTQRHEQVMGVQQAELTQAKDALAQRIANEGEVNRINRLEAEARKAQGESLAGKTELAITAGNKAAELVEKQRKDALATSIAGQHGPEILAGGPETPTMQQGYRDMAKAADQNWFGFGKEDAARLDAMLFRLGITDQDKRKALVMKYGFAVHTGRNWAMDGPGIPADHPEYIK